MLEQFFLNLIEISLQASILILAIVLLRVCFKNIPKQYICMLWVLAAIRLLVPFQITSSLSLVPDTSGVQNLSQVTLGELDSTVDMNMDTFEHMSPVILPNTSGTPVVSDTITNADSIHPVTVPDVVPSEVTASTYSLSEVLAIVWIFIAAAFMIYGILSYLRTKRTLRESIHDSENIWYCDNIPSPFVMGYVKPRIYIPYNVDAEQLPYIIAHEKAHIAHFDHVGKLIGYLLLCIYWFNPVIWIGYILYCRDLELACDERVLEKLGIEQKKSYSLALLNCSVNNKFFLQSPLAFSEVAIKERIKHVLDYKKPGFWGIILAACSILICTLCFMTNSAPKDNITEYMISKATAEDLSIVTASFTDTDFLLEMPKRYTADAFRILDEIPEKNVTLYTLLDGSALIIKENDILYPVLYPWYVGGRIILPELYKSDYDKDGTEEYALVTLEGSGSDCQEMALTILEPDNGELRMQQFLPQNVFEQLSKEISYTYAGDTFEIKTHKHNALLNVSYWNEKLGGTYSELGWGTHIDFEERDGQWWIIVPAGIKEKDAVSPFYNCGAVFSGPVQYSDNSAFEINELYIDLVDDRTYFGDESEYAEQIANFPGTVKLLEDGTFVSTTSLQDHECAVATKSDTKEQIYFWANNAHRSSPKTYPLEFADGVLRDVPAKVVTEDELLEYPFGQTLLQTVYKNYPYGIKQYIMRDNGMIHVNIGFEDDIKSFLSLEYLTFAVSEDFQTVRLTDFGFGYYLLGINNVESLDVFRKDFTGEGHFLPSNTSQLPWNWLLSLNGETINTTTISAEEVPVINHSPDFYSFQDLNIWGPFGASDRFIQSEIWNNGVPFTELRYKNSELDLVIILDTNYNVTEITYNGEPRDIPEGFTASPRYFGYAATPYMLDVNQDGVKEFVVCWYTRGTGYLPEGCDVYRLDTPDLEQIPFDTDITEIVNDMAFEVTNYDAETETAYYTIKYQEQMYSGSNHIPSETLDMLSDSDDYPKDLSAFLYQTPNTAKIVKITLEDDTFQMGQLIHGVSSEPLYLGEITADYKYDSSLNRFVFDMDTVKFEVY